MNKYKIAEENKCHELLIQNWISIQLKIVSNKLFYLNLAKFKTVNIMAASEIA